MSHAWKDSILSNYGSGLLIYYIFCNNWKISEEEQAPALCPVIHSLLAALAGEYTGDTISNYLCDVQAWHILHGLPWHFTDNETQALLDSAAKTFPPFSKFKKQKPCTPDFMLLIHPYLDLLLPLHTAVYACLTTTFYTATHLGEFTVKNFSSFNPKIHVKYSDIQINNDYNGPQSTIFHLLHIKVFLTSEDVLWSKQTGDTDIKAALTHHFLVNNPPPSEHIFSYKFKKSYQPLIKPVFLKTLTAAAKITNLCIV